MRKVFFLISADPWEVSKVYMCFDYEFFYKKKERKKKYNLRRRTRAKTIWSLECTWKFSPFSSFFFRAPMFFNTLFLHFKIYTPYINL